MVIEIQAYFRRLARTAAWVMAGALSLCGVAGAQAPPAVTTGSIVQVTHPLYNQIYKFAYWHGYVLALDTAQSVLYQMSPGQSTFTAIYTGASTTPMGASGSYWTEDMTIDNEGNLYLPQRYGTPPLFWRVPFDPVAKTWDLTTNDAWPTTGTIQTAAGASLVSQGSSTLAFLDSGAGDGSGTLYWMTEVSPFVIYEQQVGPGGSLVGSAVSVINGLMNDDGKMSVDANGNIFFVENPGAADSGRVNGAFFIPGGSTGLSGEGSITNLIPTSYASTNKFNGATLDAAGNLYLTSESDGYGGTFDGDFVIPNTCGPSQADVFSSSCYNWDNASYISPVGANNPLTVDPRGFLWIPHYGDYSFPNSGTYGGPDDTTNNFCAGGACNFVVWQMGSDNLGSSAVGSASSTGTVFVNFNNAETLTSIGFSQPGSGTDFATTSTNPYPSTSTTTPTQPCATATTSPYQPQTSCPVWLTMTPRTVGGISGQLTLADSNGAVSGGTTYLSGVGQGPVAALLGIPTQTAMAAGLSTPAQVAVDTQGNVYVADPGLGKVLEFAPGSSAAAGVSIGKGLSKPTGVAVDGSGDVYIGDSGNIYEIPFVNGALKTASQATLFSTNTVPSDIPPNNNLLLGNHLNLAVDGQGDVFATDMDNMQVIEINNPSTAFTQNGYSVVGSGFKSPSAIAADSQGDLFVADGSNLYEITPWGAQTLLDSNLASVTGLAVEPSGSVDVAQQGGITRIPSLGGSFTVNDASSIDTASTAPNGVAIDNQGNLYITDMTGGTPNLFEVNTTTNTAFDFGQVGAFIAQEQDVSVFNVGNAPLTFSANPTFSDTTDFSLVSPDSSACDTTGATPVSTGASCNFGVQIDAQGTGAISSSMTVASSAVNGTQTANFTATALLTLEPTAAAISLSPATATFPGSTTATVTITQAPLGGGAPSSNVPDGNVTVTLTSTVQGSSQPPIVFTGTASGTDTSTTATINLTSLPGGSYNVKAAYKGNTNYGGSTATTTLVVSPAPPVIAATEPSAVSPDQFNGVYYVGQSSTSTITATVSSTLGAPTGTVTFTLDGTTPADPTQVNQPLDANGQVVFNLQNLQLGTYNLIAVYSGDSNFASAKATPVAFQVLPTNGAVLITASPNTVSTPAGTPVSTTLSLESLVGFGAQGGVNITCDNSTLPQYSECTFNNPQPTICPPPGNAAANCPDIATTVVTVSTNIPVNVGSLPSDSPYVLAGVLGLGLFGFGLRRKKLISQGFFNVICLTLLLAGTVVGFTGCTNSGYTHTPPAPHYTTPSGTSNVSIIVTDESSGQQYSLPFTLPVTVTSSSN